MKWNLSAVAYTEQNSMWFKVLHVKGKLKNQI